jgi:thymidylate kinase
MGRAISVNQLLTKRRKYLELSAEWLGRVGKPEVGNRWFIMAPTGSGKTTFICQLAKDLCENNRVGYVSAEEGDSVSLRLALERVGVSNFRTRFIIYDHRDVDALDADLAKHKSPNVVIVDSVQFFSMTKKKYQELVRKHPNKTFIWVSHMDGKKADGELAMFIWRDSGVKIVIEGYAAFIRSSRYGGSLKPWIVWRDGAEKYHGFDFIQQWTQ